MSFGQRDQTILSDLDKAQAIHKDIQELLSFYKNLFQVQFAFKSRLGASGKSGNFENKDVNLTGLTNGLPQITFEDLNIQATPFLNLYKSIVQLLIPYAGDSYGLETDPLPEKIVEWAQEIFLGRGSLVTPGDLRDRARLVTGFVLAPYLQLACDLILPRVPLYMWHRGYCPICGGWPALAALISDTSPRTLLCPRCLGEWSFSRIGCPFCGSSVAQIYYSGGEGRHRLYVCEACNRYLKTVDFRERGAEWCLPVECLVTVSMDIAALERGFTSC